MLTKDMNVQTKKEKTNHGERTRYYQGGRVLSREFNPKSGEIVFLESKDGLRLVEVLSKESGDNRFKYKYIDDKSVETSYGYFYKVNQVR